MYSSNRADVLVRHEPRAVGQEQLQHGRGSCGWCSRSCSATRSFPLRAGGAGRLRRGAGELPARRLLPGPRSFFVDTPVPGWTTIAVLLVVFNGVTSRCCRCSASTSSAPSTRSARRTPTTSSSGCSGVTRHLPGRSAPSAAARPTCTRCSTRTPRSRWRGPRARSPRCSSPTSSAGRGRDWYRATYFAHAADEPLLGREEHQLPRGPRGRRRGPRRVLGDAADRRPAARPGRSGRLELARSAPTTAWRTAPLEEALRENLDGPPPWDPRAHVGLAVRLPRARPLRRLPDALARRASRRRRHVLFLEELLATTGRRRATSTRALGVDPALPAAGAGPTRSTQSAAAAAGRSTPTSWRALREYFADSDRALEPAARATAAVVASRPRPTE